MNGEYWNEYLRTFNREHWNKYATRFSEIFEDSEEDKIFFAAVNDRQLAAVIQRHMRSDYIGWLDYKVPALDYLTPRDCLATEEGRDVLRAMLMRCH